MLAKTLILNVKNTLIANDRLDPGKKSFWGNYSSFLKRAHFAIEQIDARAHDLKEKALRANEMDQVLDEDSINSPIRKSLSK